MPKHTLNYSSEMRNKSDIKFFKNALTIKS